MNIKAWIRAALIRAARTFAQSFASAITVGAALTEVDWAYILSVAAVAAILSLATSAAGLPEVQPGEREEDADENL